MEEENIDKWKKYFKNFDLFWKPATRVNFRGRAIAGSVYGVNKNFAKTGLKHSFQLINGTVVIIMQNNDINFHIIPVYIRGSDWSNEFHDLKTFFTNNSDTNSIVVGDMNVRIGAINQDIDDIHKSKFTAGLEERKSEDKIVNSKGKQLIEFFNDYGLVVLNGYTTGDEEGSYTYISTLGNSVNDICAISQEALQFVKQFQVETKVWSDHMPLRLTLSVKGPCEGVEEMNLLPKLKWKEAEKEKYNKNLNKNLRLQRSQGNFINLEKLVNIIKISLPNQQQNKKQPIFKTKWFNYKCLKARKLSFDLLNIFRKTKNIQDKEKYQQAKHRYVIECKNQKEKYYIQLNNKINNVNDSKNWWKIAKEIRGDCFRVGTNISAAELKQYFQNLLNQQQITDDIQYATMWHIDDDLDREITVEEIRKVLQSTKPNKAPGADRVPYEMFKNASVEFLDELVKSFNVIFETGNVGEEFAESIIFPIHKKGDLNNPSNYRGISFMNCAAKVLMGTIHSRLINWVEKYNILNEFQAGFRPQYSTADNIFNLASIVHWNFKEKKKTYAFFVDFKAAFDRVPRGALIYKLQALGISTKVVNLIQNVYRNTKSAVWTGSELSESFETYTGVKQGCLLSPLLFTLFLNDLHEQLGGGLTIDDLNVRLLLYADDIVLLADDIEIMQRMVKNLEVYCDQWNMEINMMKSQMMIFRKGGRLSSRERIKYKEQYIDIVNEYNYLGVILTPKMIFRKHLEKRNNSAKNSINATWSSFLSKKDITLETKWKLFQSVCRSIQSYAAQIWGCWFFDEVDALQRYFLKRILKLPDFTPNYALILETNAEVSYFYTLNLHMNYIFKTIYQYNQNRLPHKLSLITLRNNIFWAERMNELGTDFDIRFENDVSAEEWLSRGSLLLQQMKTNINLQMHEKALNSRSRFYKYLNLSKGVNYINNKNNLTQISTIFKTRCDILPLNGNKFDISENRTCSLCNTREDENLIHFMAKCPILREFRIRHLGKNYLNENEVINILNGEIPNGWEKLYNYVNTALNYRKSILEEFL